MKIIFVICDERVEAALSVNDDDEQDMLDALCRANDKLEPGNRCHIHSTDPDTFEAALDLIESM